MDLEKNEDIRVTKSKQALQDSLLELLNTKDINNISITKLCSNAKINRTTFYKYYSSPIDVLNEIQNNYIDEVKEFIMLNNSNSKLSNYDRFLYRFKKINKDNKFCKILLNENVNNKFFNEIMFIYFKDLNEDLKKNYKSHNESDFEYIFLYLCTGCSAIIKRWIYNDFKESPEHISKLMKLIIDGIGNIYPDIDSYL